MPATGCSTCGKKIEGKYFKTPDGGATCITCAEKKAGFCYLCDKTMLNRQGVVVDGNVIHSECFACGKCKKGISGAYHRRTDIEKQLGDKAPKRGTFTKDGGPSSKPPKEEYMCPDCAQTLLPSYDCMFCKKAILPGEDMAKLGEGKCFHPVCFACYKCKKPIQGSYVNDKTGYLC